MTVIERLTVQQIRFDLLTGRALTILLNQNLQGDL